MRQHVLPVHLVVRVVCRTADADIERSGNGCPVREGNTVVNRRMIRNERGFSLLELLAVIGIIGVLGAIATPMYMNHKASGVRTALESDARNNGMEILATLEPITHNGVTSQPFSVDTTNSPIEIVLGSDVRPAQYAGGTVTVPKASLSSGNTLSGYLRTDNPTGPNTGFCIVVTTPEADQSVVFDESGLRHDMADCAADGTATAS